MLVLDTDHLSALPFPGAAADRLANKLKAASQDVQTTIISVEEQLRGWLGEIHKRDRNPLEQVPVYDRLGKLVRFFGHWRILDFDDQAADVYNQLRRQKVRVGSMDLKVASIVLAQSGTLLSRNLADFRKVPGLRVEDWLVD